MLECLRVAQIDELGGATLFFWLGIAFLLYWTARGYFFGRRYFVISLVAMLYWLIAVVMELNRPSLHCKGFWGKCCWPAIGVLPTAWAFFRTGAICSTVPRPA